MISFPKAVLFDWDNTLVDTLEVNLFALNETLKRFGHPQWTMEQMITSPHLSVKDSFQGLFLENSLQATEFYYQVFESVHLSALKKLPNSEELLSFLCEKGVFMGVVSNKSGKFLRLEIEILAWNRYFTSIIGSQDCADDKPSPLPVVEALKKGSFIPNKDVWFVGDSAVDMQCARQSGCVPIFVGTHLPEEHNHTDIMWAENCLGILSLLKEYSKIAV